MSRTARVSIVYRFLPHYRVEFFSRLRDAMAQDGVRLELVYGVNKGEEDVVPPPLAWATRVENRLIDLGGRRAIWQSLPGSVAQADLTVLMQENRLLSNYPLLARGIVGRSRIALWGHGINFEQRRNSAANRFKLLYSRRVHWWFAYTDGVAESLAESGFPRERITVVENAIDSEALTQARRRLDPKEILRTRLGIGAGPVGIYCGRLYAQKRIDLLLDAAERLRARLPGFELIVIGDGPDAERVRRAAMTWPWLHYVGAKHGLDRVPYFGAADAFLLPGAVGLAVLDAFALETPMVTTERPDHGPEIGYLRSGQNGVVTPNSVEEYVEGAARVLSDQLLRNRMADAGRDAAARFSIGNMVSNFRQGVLEALDASPTRPARAR